LGAIKGHPLLFYEVLLADAEDENTKKHSFLGTKPAMAWLDNFLGVMEIEIKALKGIIIVRIPTRENDNSLYVQSLNKTWHMVKVPLQFTTWAHVRA
jgi:hypothetical protein